MPGARDMKDLLIGLVFGGIADDLSLHHVVREKREGAAKTGSRGQIVAALF